MKRRWKKAAAFLLALVMCVSLLPMNAAASDDEVEETPILTQAPMCVLEVTDRGLVMTEINPEFTVEEVKAATAAPISVALNLKSMLD